MRIVLLDTNVVSYLFKGDTRAAGYTPLLQVGLAGLRSVSASHWHRTVYAKIWSKSQDAGVAIIVNSDSWPIF